MRSNDRFICGRGVPPKSIKKKKSGEVKAPFSGRWFSTFEAAKTAALSELSKESEKVLNNIARVNGLERPEMD